MSAKINLTSPTEEMELKKNKTKRVATPGITAEMQEEKSACHKTSTLTTHCSSTAQHRDLASLKQPWEARAHCETHTATLRHRLEHRPNAHELHELLPNINPNKTRNRKNTK